jgi:two-component system chemotaxis sensor kinase CheA
MQDSSGASILHDDRAIPFTPLASALFGRACKPQRSWMAVIVAGPRGAMAIGVDRLMGVAGIVVRPLPGLIAASPLVSGAFLDANGNPQLVLDPDLLSAAAESAVAKHHETAALRKPILVVDDSMTTRMLEKSILESAGHAVDTALSAEEALDRVRDQRYALVLVDVEMPGMDGFTFIERIRSDPGVRDLPAILVSSRGAPEDLKRGRDVGAQGYMVKSEFDQAALLSMIDQLVH